MTSRFYGPFEINGQNAPQGTKHWTPSAYEEAVCHQIDRVIATTTGGALIAELARFNVRIVPEEKSDDIDAACDGTGKVYYTPGKYIPGYVLYRAKPNAIGYSADETLLHELVHAMQKLTGKTPPDIPRGVSLKPGETKTMFPKGLELYEAKKTDGSGNEYTATEMAIHRDVNVYDLLTGKARSMPVRYAYHSVPEFNAVLIANVYISEKNSNKSFCRPTELQMRGEDLSQCYHLRKDHEGDSAPVPLRDPLEYLNNHWTNFLANELWTSHRNMSRRIALAPAEFNPFRDISIVNEPQRFMVEFLHKHDMTKEQFAYFVLTMRKLRARLSKKQFKQFLNGRVLTPAADPNPPTRQAG